MKRVECYFEEDSEIDKVAELSKGDKINVKGKCNGKSIYVDIHDAKIKYD